MATADKIKPSPPTPVQTEPQHPEEAHELIPATQQTDEEAEAAREALERETRCGWGPLKPAWLQRLASKKAYVIVYGLTGCSQAALASYFIATISTMEKRFKIPSKTSGVISSAWDMGSMVTTLLVAYLGRNSHKTRWVACETVLVALSCYIRLLPHWLYGPGDDALAVTQEFGDGSAFSAGGNLSDISAEGPNMALCGNNYTHIEDCDNADSGHISSVLIFISHFMVGVGTSAYYTLGIAYLDDNALKNKAPMLMALCQCLRMIGPTFGYLLASYALDMFVDPSLTPTVDTKDPRWVGAWWYGWNYFGLVSIILALVIGMFPRSLPRAAQRSAAAAAAKGQVYNPEAGIKHSLKDFKLTVTRLLKNKVFVCNSLSSVFYTFGLTGQWVFMPKYMETQFHQSASTASLISGSVGLLCTAAGVFSSAAFISRFKPRPRRLAGWNVLVEFNDVLMFILMVFIGCTSTKLHGTPQDDGTLSVDASCMADCGCPESLHYSPVCDLASSTTFFSACHAGCGTATWLQANSSVVGFSDCACVEGGGPVIDGSCPVDCTQAFLLFIIIQCVQRFLGATGRAGNILLQIRCVNPADKSVAIGFTEFLLYVFSFIPGPIVFGMLIDMSCLVWGQTCGETGNCWLYDIERLRYLVNLPITGFLILGTLWDVGVWYYAEGLELYDVDGEVEGPKNGVDMRPDSGEATLARRDSQDDGGSGHDHLGQQTVEEELLELRSSSNLRTSVQLS